MNWRAQLVLDLKLVDEEWNCYDDQDFHLIMLDSRYIFDLLGRETTIYDRDTSPWQGSNLGSLEIYDFHLTM